MKLPTQTHFENIHYKKGGTEMEYVDYVTKINVELFESGSTALLCFFNFSQFKSLKQS